jgi:predicted nucleic acid-binding protein
MRYTSNAIIAATARWHGAALATLHRRHYPMIGALVIPY